MIGQPPRSTLVPHATLFRPTREAYRHPAHLVAFDVLQVDGREVLDQPLTARRAALADVLADAPPQLTLCPQTTDPAEAREWRSEEHTSELQSRQSLVCRLLL